MTKLNAHFVILTCRLGLSYTKGKLDEMMDMVDTDVDSSDEPPAAKAKKGPSEKPGFHSGSYFHLQYHANMKHY